MNKSLIVTALFLGEFGIHDFMIGRKRAGLMHLCLLSIAPILTMLALIFGNAIPSLGLVLDGGFSLIELPIILVSISWVWGMIEAVIYVRKHSPNKNSAPLEQQYELSQKTITTISTITKITSSITLVLELFVIGSMYSMITCVGNNCKSTAGDLVVLFICFLGLIPFILSVILTVYAYRLRFIAKKNNQLTTKTEASLRISFILFWIVMVGFVAIVIGFMNLLSYR